MTDPDRRRVAHLAGDRPGRPARPARPATTEGDRLSELEGRLTRLESSPGLRARGRGLMARVVPAEATRHFRSGGRENLLGLRSILDFWIERVDDEDGQSDRRGRHESIDID